MSVSNQRTCVRYMSGLTEAALTFQQYHCTSLNHVMFLWWDDDEILKITSIFVCDLYRETPVRAVKCVSE